MRGCGVRVARGCDTGYNTGVVLTPWDARVGNRDGPGRDRAGRGGARFLEMLIFLVDVYVESVP